MGVLLVCSFLLIAIITALIGDLAKLFGCAIDLRLMTTAITVVALGTSLPDTFASKTAAQQDPYADACIGNVTGSNSVNVFLGLGIPWSIAAVYWHFRGPDDAWLDYKLRPDTKHVVLEWEATGLCQFVVPAKGLDTSVIVFIACAVTCLAFLVFRRVKFGGELGGPSVSAKLSSLFLVFLWLVYITISIAFDYSD